MDDSDVTLNGSEVSSSEQEFLSEALDGFSSRKPEQRPRGCDRPYGETKNHHAKWWSYLISITLVILVVLALYYLNVDTATIEYRNRYRILTGIILVLAVLHVLISAY